MTVKAVVRKNQYQDSVRLMTVSRQVSALDRVNNCLALLGTDGNKKVIKDLGLMDAGVKSATPNDLVICIDAASAKDWERAVAEVDKLLEQSVEGDAGEEKAGSLSEALETNKDINMALFSIPGQFAKLDVMEALEKGLNVMLFSDNVSLEDEILLKKIAVQKNLLMMGPDCGTSIINGVPLAFANVVKRGSVGIVAASGTGIQEVTCLIDSLGGGISHAIGVGGRDMKKGVDGMMMSLAIDKLARDKNTKTLVLISKPGDKAAMTKVMARARKTGMPVVACFLGRGRAVKSGRGVTAVNTLEEAAFAAMKRKKPALKQTRKLSGEIKALGSKRKYIRGLYSGGTLCYEALLLYDGKLDVHSNIALDAKLKLKYPAKGKKHYCIDMGDDDFTKGKPHPMIDSTLRTKRFVEEYRNPSTAVILFDVVLGYGASDDPAGDIIDAIKKAEKKAGSKIKKGGDGPVLMAQVCGTNGDPQSLNAQEAKLGDAGVHLFATNADAVRASIKAVERKL
ncbi:MAG: acyl-CoA synthetase FdrA [Nitrospinota bacterium]